MQWLWFMFLSMRGSSSPPPPPPPPSRVERCDCAPARAERPVQVSRYWSAGRFSLRVIVWRDATAGFGTVRDSICRSRERVSVDISPCEKPVAESARARVCGRYAGNFVGWPSVVGPGTLSHVRTCARATRRVRGWMLSCMCVWV